MTHDRKKASRFPETRWSLVGRAAASDDAVRHKALAELLSAYLPGLRAFLVEARRVPADVADDLLNGFVADKVLAAGLVRHADQNRGKFRNFVLKSLNNFVTTKLRGHCGPRVLQGDFDEERVVSRTSGPATDCFERQWVQQVVRDALQMMEADCKARGRSDLWEMFRWRVVDPMLRDAEPIDYGAIVQRLGIGTPRQAMNLLATAKRAFMGHLREAVGKYVKPNAIDGEIDDLRQIVDR
jgi:hypothetical protein